jgi:hypothetical protein
MADEKTQPPRQPNQGNPQQGSGDDSLRQEVRDLRNALASMRATLPVSLLPEHSAGPGQEIADTWSLAEQEEAQGR